MTRPVSDHWLIPAYIVLLAVVTLGLPLVAAIVDGGE